MIRDVGVCSGSRLREPSHTGESASALCISENEFNQTLAMPSAREVGETRKGPSVSSRVVVLSLNCQESLSLARQTFWSQTALRSIPAPHSQVV